MEFGPVVLWNFLTWQNDLEKLNLLCIASLDWIENILTKLVLQHRKNNILQSQYQENGGEYSLEFEYKIENIKLLPKQYWTNFLHKFVEILIMKSYNLNTIK